MCVLGGLPHRIGRLSRAVAHNRPNVTPVCTESGEWHRISSDIRAILRTGSPGTHRTARTSRGGVRDVITDFAPGTDKLDLRALGITDFAAQISSKAIGSGLILYADLDQDGIDSADFAVQLTGVWSLSPDDVLI